VTLFAGTALDAELERHRALERVLDAGSRRFLGATGVGAGWRCLEVGAGGGSVAAWLGETVGSGGTVVALDTDTRLLTTVVGSNVEARTGDVRTSALPSASFQLVHARHLLVHVPAFTDALGAMMNALAPGGWLVLEEPDFSSARAFTGSFVQRQAFGNVNRAREALFRKDRMDLGFGTRLPGLVQTQGLQELLVENDAAIVRGGSPEAVMMGLAVSHRADAFVATGAVTPEDIAHYVSFAADPACWATYHATIRATGRKPL
jgi:SAM-dependent methyltransferase